MDDLSYLGNNDIEAVENLYRKYKEDPDSLDVSWKKFFEGFEFSSKVYDTDQVHSEKIEKEFKVIELINGYRKRGHLFTKTNPVRTRRQYTPTLDLENYGLGEEDLETEFHAGKEIGIGTAKLSKIVQYLNETYCESIGSEYMFIRKPDRVNWLKEKIESSRNRTAYSIEQKKNFYFHLRLAVGFEQFIHRKFVGQKRFSLEGTEAIIPALNNIIEVGSENGISEFIIGMAHRGRLNVLGNIMQKPYENIFQEFIADEFEDDIALGDVKYHLGYGNDIKTSNGKMVRVNLVPNPSHLETVLPIIQGISRAKIDQKYKDGYNRLLPIAIHGDAAIAAQGVVYEVIQMVEIDGYKTGGTIHIVINNQLGFTTNYLEARSSTYCTDIGKVTKSPIFHVNGDDVEALAHVTDLAIEYRQTFHSDVFIDILSYRKYGHNESDEPRFTQPLLYKQIAKHPSPREIYANKLIEEGIFNKDQIKQFEKDFNDILEDKFSKSKSIDKVKIKRFLIEDWKNFEYAEPEDFEKQVKTGFDHDKLIAIGKKINTLPKNLKFINKIKKMLEDRLNMIDENRLDWAMGELLAYGSLVMEGHPVRLSGQDSERGTFAHRHASFVVDGTDEKYFPLKHVSENQAPFHVFNSLLSEYAVMGFEYGYALAQPNGLTIWEAQFGDFHNVAQVIIDQYITSAFEKWGLMNNLVLLLPHGYEGQGPEHSSARIERFLQQAANNNLQVVVPTTPANMFHLLRRQVKMKMRLPLVVFTPKSLLRHPMVHSKIEDLAKGTFRELIDDTTAEPDLVEKVVFTSGRLYYDLAKHKSEKGIDNVAIVRMEQLYPIPNKPINQILKKYGKSTELIWAQDEPENMGAWPFIERKLNHLDFKVVARKESGSPAVGLMEIHKQGLEKLLETVFKENEVVAS